MNGNYQLGDRVLGNWKLVRTLGQGSYGTVYEASGRTLERYTVPRSKSLRSREVEARSRAPGLRE